MLVRDPSTRATATEVLKHEWIKENGVAADVEIEPEVGSWAAGCWQATNMAAALFTGACSSAGPSRHAVQHTHNSKPRICRINDVDADRPGVLVLTAGADPYPLLCGHEQAEEGGAQGDRGQPASRGDRRAQGNV
jgi:hypothetical protein